MTTIKFEDHGQDFLEWDIDDKGIVVDSRPCQAWLWNGTKVGDHENIKVGDFINIKPKAGVVGQLKYAVTEIHNS
jgi:hypothetical protein